MPLTSALSLLALAHGPVALVGAPLHVVFPTTPEVAEYRLPAWTVDRPFNEALISWNVENPESARLAIEARAQIGDRWTKWYRMADWQLADPAKRVSIAGQADEDGDVQTDTLHLNTPGRGIEVRFFLSRTQFTGPIPVLKFASVCTSDTQFRPASDTARSAAWGITLDVPRKYQHAYEGGGVWCSPTSCSMILNHYARLAHRPELALDVPDVAAGVFDPVYNGTGNWSFNTAYMGSFPGLTSYVTRLRGTQDVERWIEAGIPVTCSVSLDLLKGKENPRPSGHLVVVVGFDEHGDPVINDPDHKPDVRTTYRRDHFERAWLRSNRTVYLAHLTDAKIPVEPGAPWWQRP